MPRSTFEWHGSHPAADFVNTLDERLSPAPQERLPDYEALVEFARQSHLIDEATARRLRQDEHRRMGQRVWSVALQLREALYTVLLAVTTHRDPGPQDIARIEAEIRRATAARHLTPKAVGVTWSWKQPDSPKRPLWELALAAEDLLVSAAVRRTRKCAADDCGVIFVDDSRAGLRRWCSMAACGNRHKVRQFRSTRRRSVRTRSRGASPVTRRLDETD